ncbi:3-oxoacyl-ACP reductase [Actinoplanes ianthinogenes]|uniref:3-oxoacyl-ACP reductase n=1 Tax=Actinoplanes ianthinogenes TaxID=122358 RepID=A0ABM7M7X4_9ACTN|nr:SDR family NAD(P)-dependent oxidoreductase [Actinoplanes ianthinogenes]BCJ47715.1 3-oxoacyl-ACP reductase [Actinoplanes ianthinogenes]GGR03675.1 3-oxoacyl-ACP reductase [Actinoplanes ianthinogenes]
MANILITGASDGLGRALATELARAGHQLIVHGRDPARLAAVADETGAVAIRADLSSLDEVRGLAARAAEHTNRLDVLVNNAGVGFGAPGAGRELSRDGYELRFAVNYLAPYLLTRLLLPVLHRAASARIVNVASVGQRPIELDDLMMEREYDGVEAYRRSKLALIAHTFDLADELAGTGVTANCLHPASLMPTTMVHESRYGTIDSLEQGLQATLRLVADPDLDGVTGRYFNGMRVGRALDQAYDLVFRARLRERTEALLSTRQSS